MMQELFKEKYHDDVMGHVDIEQWLKIINWCKNYNA